MIIKDVLVYTEEKKFVYGAVRIVGDRIAQIWLEKEAEAVEQCKASDEEYLEGKGCYLIPGMIDLHIHGCRGYDFCDGTLAAVEKIAEYQASIGVTTFVPAMMTLPIERLEDILKNAAQYVKKREKERLPKYADLGGINMEGPFISREKKGAQDEKNILLPDKGVFERFQQSAEGLVKYIGLAPEADGAEVFIQQVKEDVKVTIAHSNADYETAVSAFRSGVCHVTHLYNAMSAFGHREPGIPGAVMDTEGVEAELICDGLHVHPAVIRSTFTILGTERIIMVSDSMRAAGMPEGSYELGGQKVIVKGKRAFLEDGTIAGSVTSLPDCLRYVVTEVGIPLEEAVACVTMNPARSLGIFKECGSLVVGKRADMVLLDRKLEKVAVIKGGAIITPPQ
ncbi:MAG: N-acetylglucosamine-6-phosphate deacetylase [Lachnospiraceae bacterium]|nr:N-acetylglucosamine-6-phosphate deacetylase [Lachnospiraceae bacterium]